MKRSLALILSLVMMFGVLPMHAFATEEVAETEPTYASTYEGEDTAADYTLSGTCGAALLWALDSDGTLTISGTGEMYDYGYRPAEEIVVMPPWSAYKNDIVTVVMDNGITNIGQMAFEGCGNLTGIELSNAITSIGANAFSNCGNLVNVNLPESVSNIGNFAFSGCKSLTGIQIPSGVTSIGMHAFSNCSGLISVELPAGITEISARMFNGCSNLTSMNIPVGVTRIGEYAFRGCTSLNSIELPTGVVSIDEHAFSNCSNLTSIKLPDSLTSIGDNAFSTCSSLTSIKIPAGVTSVGKSAFFNCYSLESIELPHKITSIGEYTFFGYNQLTGVEIPASVTSIGTYAFGDCYALETITFAGDAPVIAGNAFSSGIKTPVTVNYPGNNSTWTEEVRQNYGRELTWVAYCANGEHTFVNNTCTGCGDVHPGPVITKQPTDAETNLGEKFTISVEAEGEGLTYQWYYRNTKSKTWNLSSYKTAIYKATMANYVNGRQYYCVITDKYGNSVTTDVVTASLPPVELKIITQPADIQAENGEAFTISMEVQGDGLSYQWYYRNAKAKDWTVSGRKIANYKATMTNYVNGRQYYCVITDKYGNSVTTDVATASLPPVELKIITQPADIQAENGEAFTISMEVQGDGLSYQWYYRGAKAKDWTVSGRKIANYKATMTNYVNGRQYYCVITDKYGNSVTTDVVTASLPPVELKIITQPADIQAENGEAFTISMEVQGDGLSYQWYYRGAKAKDWTVSAHKSATYKATMANYINGRQYYCVITDQYGNQVATDVATVHVAN